MSKRDEIETEPVEQELVEEDEGQYGLHIRLQRGMQQKLKDAAELAFKMGDIPKPDLINLMNLYINWGLAIQKRKWLDRMGYR